MRFSVGLPPNLPFEAYAGLAGLVERYDFSLVVIDDIPNFKSSWGILFHLARETRRVHLGPSVTHPYQRHPLVTVANVASLDELSGGRAFLGWGRGDASDHQAMHLPMPRPLRALREAVALTRHLLSGSQAAFEGELFRLAPDFGLGFRALRPDMPVYLGTTGPRGFRLAGEVADGVHAAGLLNAPAIVAARREIAAGAAAAGRSPVRRGAGGELLDVGRSRWGRRRRARQAPFGAPAATHPGVRGGCRRRQA